MSELKGSRVLVTGAAGFIGSNLVDHLLALGAEVVGLDNLSTGRWPNLNAALEHPKFRFVEGDIRNAATCAEVCRGCSVVFHQAALGSVPRSIEDPMATTDHNAIGFMQVLLASRAAGVQRVVYATSSSVYGDSQQLPKVEEVIGRPLSPYAISKAMNEQHARVFFELYGLETVGLRYFNVFGQRQHPEGEYAAAIPRFIKALMAHRSPIIFGDGEQSRDFTYIANVMQANVLAATAGLDAVGEVFNVAYGQATTLNELVASLTYELSAFDEAIKAIKPEYGAPRTGDVRHSQASIEKAKSALGYKPTHDLRRGMHEAVRWYWENLK